MDETERMTDDTEVPVREHVASDIDRLMDYYASLPKKKG